MPSPDTPYDGHRDDRPRRPRVVRFGLRELLAFMLVVAVASSYASYMIRAIEGGGLTDRVAFVLLVTLAPLVTLSILRVAVWCFPRPIAPHSDDPFPKEPSGRSVPDE